MADLVNSFEGIANGVTITTANSGGASGDAFTLETDTTGGTCTASTAWAAAGSVSMAFSLSTTGGPERRGYEVNAGDSSATQFFRFYINSDECSGAISPLRGMNATSSGQRFRVGFNASTRVLTLLNNSNGTVWTATALDAGVDYRVEVATEGSTSATARVRIYQGHSTTATEDSGDLTSVNTGGPIREVWWGQTNAATSVSGKLDAIGWSDTAQLGPATTPAEGPIAITLPAATAAAAGSVTVSGSVSAGLPAVTAAAAGTVLVDGQLLTTLPASVASGAGTVVVDGQLAATLPTAVFATAGTVLVSGSIATTLPAATAALAGTLSVDGAAAVALPALSLTAAGAVTAAGTLAATLPAAGAALAGSSSVTGALGVTLPAAVVAVVGGTTGGGVLAVTLPALSIALRSSGQTVIRPSTGTVTRPSTGTVTRPDTGLVLRP